MSSISVVTRVRTPALILAPEQRLVIEPNASIHSLFLSPVCFFHSFYTSLFILHLSLLLLSLFAPFLFIPINLFQTYGPQWNPGSSNLLMISSPSRTRLFFGVFHLILRTFLFRCVFLKFITNCQTFLSLFLKSSFLTTIDGTLSARKFIILVNHILMNVKSAKGTVRMRSKTSRKYFALSL